MHDARAGDFHFDPVVDAFSLNMGHGTALYAADHHAGFSIIESGGVLVGADFGEQLRVDLCPFGKPA